MSGAGAGAARKPVVSSNGRPERCLCNHRREEHVTGACGRCKCARYHPRPCVCGHSTAHHSAAAQCVEPGCECKRFREDGSPEFLLRMGIHAGNWQFITTAQLRWLMRPDQPDTVRIWACGMLHSIGQRSRLAVKIDRGQRVPLTPTDIMNELNALDTIPRFDRHNLARGIRALESSGAARRHGSTKANVQLFFYATPRKIVVRSDNNESGSDGKENHLPDQLIFRLRGAVVKSFFAAVREGIKSEDPDFVVTSDHQKLIDEVLQQALFVVESAYQKALIVVRSAGAYKEDSSTSNTSSAAPGLNGKESSQSVTTVQPPETDLTAESPTDDEIRRAIPTELLERVADTPGPGLLRLIRTALAGAPVQAFADRLRRRLHAIQSLGALPAIAANVGGAYQEAGRSRQEAQAQASRQADRRTQMAKASELDVLKDVLADPFVCQREIDQILASHPDLREWHPDPAAVERTAELRIRQALKGLQISCDSRCRKEFRDVLHQTQERFPELLERIKKEEKC